MSSRFIKILCFLFLSFPILSFANVTGTDINNFNPTDDGVEFVSVESAQGLSSGKFNFGYFLVYSTNSLAFFPLPSVSTNQTFIEPNDRLVSHDLHFAWGISDWWGLGVSLPMILDQSVDDSTNLATFSATGLNEIRVNNKIRLFNRGNLALGIKLSVSLDQVKNNPFIGMNPGPTFNGELLLSKKISPTWSWGLNLGYRHRSPGDNIIIGQGTATEVTFPTMGSQFTYSVAFSHLFQSWGTRFIFELFGSTPLEEITLFTDRKSSNLEAILGAKWMLSDNLALHIGVGTEGYHGLATADIRGYAGLNYNFGFTEELKKTKPKVIKRAKLSNDRDRDGVLNGKDMCPRTPPRVKVNHLGCSLKRVRKVVLSDLKFLYDKVDLTKGSEARLQKIIRKIYPRRKSIKKIVIEGHTDAHGSQDYNQSLSERRALTIEKYFKKYLKKDIVSLGYGEDVPVDSNETNRGRARNRRVEIQIIKEFWTYRKPSSVKRRRKLKRRSRTK